jgi:hypothetical protein
MSFTGLLKLLRESMSIWKSWSMKQKICYPETSF